MRRETSDTEGVSPDPIDLPPSLRQVAIRASLWTSAGFLGTQALRLGGNLVLTRLLFPEAFGVMSLVWAFMTGLQWLSDAGIRQSSVRSRRGEDPDFLRVAWTIQVLRGALLWGVALLAAGPLATLYAEPELARLIPVAGLTVLISGFQSTQLFVLDRRLAPAAQTLIEFASQAIGLFAMIVWGWIAPTIWLLVGGALVAQLLRTILTHSMIPGIRHRLQWDSSTFQELLFLGRWLFITTAVAYVAGQSDRLLLGGLVSAEVLGVYSIAFVLSDAGKSLAQQICQRVLYPAFSRVVRENASAMRGAYRRARTFLDPWVMGGAGLLMVGGNALVELLYDPRYAAAGWMLQLLALRVAVAAQATPAVVCLLALGSPRHDLVANVAKAGWLILSVPLAWRVAQLPGAVAAIALTDTIGLPFLWRGLRAHGLLSVRRELLSVGWVLAGVCVGWFVVRGLP